MTTLKVQRRNMETKAKKLRREGFVTGTIYGKEIKDSLPIQIEQKEADRIRRECLKGSQLNIELEGTTYDVLLKEIDYDPMSRLTLEMEFQALVKGQKVHCTTEIVLHNLEKAENGIPELLLNELSYKAYPEAILDRIDVDCTGLHLGDTLKVSDLAIAQNPDIEITTPADTLVLSVIRSKNQEAEAASEEAAEG